MVHNNILLTRLRPTQITVGMLEVKRKRKRIRELAMRPAELVEFILLHPVRVVLGPQKNVYVIDHHHLALALVKEKYETAPMEVESDLSAFTPRKFWHEMEKLRLVHPYDSEGRLKPVEHIPNSLKKLEDDPYRSLAGFVRDEGGFKKVPAPFAEFQWADFFRVRIRPGLLADDFDKAVRKAIDLARLPQAANLPGYVS